MTANQELKVMGEVAEALSALDDDAKVRVLQWVASQFGIAGGVRGTRAGEGVGTDTGFEDVASLFGAAAPSDGPEKALVVGYWVQVLEGQEDFAGQYVNDKLKDLGHGIKNITAALTSLQEQKPALVLQVRKSGKSKQARKTYKVTQAGIKKVKQMLSPAKAGEE